MTNLNRNEKLKKVMKRALIFIMMITVHFGMLEIYTPKEVQALTCSTCGNTYGLFSKCSRYCSTHKKHYTSYSGTWKCSTCHSCSSTRNSLGRCPSCDYCSVSGCGLYTGGGTCTRNCSTHGHYKKIGTTWMCGTCHTCGLSKSSANCTRYCSTHSKHKTNYGGTWLCSTCHVSGCGYAIQSNGKCSRYCSTHSKHYTNYSGTWKCSTCHTCGSLLKSDGSCSGCYCSTCGLYKGAGNCSNYCSTCGGHKKSSNYGWVHTKCHTCSAATNGYGYCGSHCHRCGGAYGYGGDTWGYCSSCKWWLCPDCSGANDPGYGKYCTLCQRYWSDTTTCALTGIGHQRGHWCCGTSNWGTFNTTDNFSTLVGTATEATCTSAGSGTYACSNTNNGVACPRTETKSIPALGHSYTNTTRYVHTNGTCQVGTLYYQECSKCGRSSQGDTNGTWRGNATGHSFTSETATSTYLRTAGSCIEDKTYWYKCAHCTAKSPDKYWTHTKGAHNYTGRTNNYLHTTGTCIQLWTYYYECVNCGGKGTSTYTTTYGDHSWGSYVVTTSGHCTRDEIETRTCSICGGKDSKNTGKKDRHDYTTACACGIANKICSRGCGSYVYHNNAPKPTLASTSYTYSASAHTPISNGSYYSVTGNSYTNAGSYSAVITIDNTSKHTFAGDDGTFSVGWTINKAGLTVTADDKSKVYGDDDPTLTASITGTKGGQTAGYTGLYRQAGERVKTYDIYTDNVSLVDNGAFKASNYQINVRNDGTFTIEHRGPDPTYRGVGTLTVNWNAPNVVYDGTYHTPVPVITYNSPKVKETLTQGTDYDVAYANNIDYGTATVTVTYKGNYSGIDSTTFQITQRPLTITPNSGQSKIYGQANPADYDFKYSNNVTGETPKFTGVLSRVAGEDIGTYLITLGTKALANNGSFKAANYSINFVDTVPYEIKALSVNDITHEWNIPTYIYSGHEKKPTITLSYYSAITGKTVTLTQGTDYTLTYTNNINASEGKSSNLPTVTVTGINNYTGAFNNYSSGFEQQFLIMRKNIGDSTITITLKDANGNVVTDSTYTYNGDQKKPTVIVTDSESGRTLVEGTDYTKVYQNNVDAFPAAHTTNSPIVIITGIGNYDETNSKTFKINRKTISGTTLTLSQYSFEYNRDEKKPGIQVYDNERKVYLVKDSDFTVAYTNHVDAYPAAHTTVPPTVTVTGINNYTNKNSITFTITPKPLSKTTYELDTKKYIYNGAQNEPTATVMDIANNVKLVQDREYTLSYVNNIDANANGYGTVRNTDPVPTTTITGINNYTGSVTRTFQIDAKQITAVWQDKDKFVYNFGQQAPYATAATGVTGESATIVTTKNTDPAYYTSRASISEISGGRARVLNYELTNTTKDYGIYIWPTVPPTIKYIDENGNDITFIDDNVGPYDLSTYPTMTYVLDPTTGKKVREWYNQDIDIYVDGSTLNGTPGDVGYMFYFDVAPNDTKVPEVYEYYGSKVMIDLLGEAAPYQQYKYDSHTGSNNFHAENGVNNIYFKSYNTHYQVDDVSGARTESGEVYRYVTKIEKTKPTMEISSNKTWSKSHTATITLADVGGSHLLEKTYTLQYSWTQSKDTPSVYDHSTEIKVARGSDIATTTITKDTDYGVWYLHVKLTEKLEDNATNFIDGADVVMYGEFWMDNKAPIISLEKNHELQVLDKTDVYKINFEVIDEHVGIDASEFTEDDIEILLQPDNTESTATKKLTHLSTTQRDGLDVHLYELEITNVSETGYFIMRIKEDRLKDKLGNGNEVTLFMNDEIGLTGDNEIPTIALTGPIEVKSITEGRNLSGVIDDRYINQEYEISMPIEVTDIGIIDIIDGLQTTDLTTFVGGILVDPLVKITLDSESEVENSVTHVKTFTKKYTLTYSGIRNDGYLFVVFNDAAVSDDTELKNVATSLRPYSIVDEMKYFTYVDNTTPRITLLNADTLQNINKDAEIVLDLKLTDDGAGIRGTGSETFEASDIIVQIDGADVIVSKKVLVSDEGNDYNSILGGTVDVNYTYVLTIQGVRKDGTLRIAIPGGNVIDKANNASEAITLETNIVLDNQGPKLGPITTNADANNQVFGGDVIVKIEGCYDENEIFSYEWQRSKDGVNWETIKLDETNSSTSSVTDSTPDDGRYYYRVIVTDTVGNSTTSEEVFVDYFTSILSIPIIRLEQQSKGVSTVEIIGTITSTLPIEKVTVNGIEIPGSELTSKVNRYQITTTFTYEATNNGVYTFVATDTNGNSAQESINVNLVDGTNAVITAKPSDATIFSDAQIVFTANEPVRIINPNGYPGITFDTSDFTTTIVATISKDVDYTDAQIFKFENKALLKTDVEVPPPIITKLQYLRFVNVNASQKLSTTIKRANMLVKKMSDSKVLSDGKIVSYYGFDGSVTVDISTTADLNAAINLGNAGKIQIMDTVGKPVELKTTVADSVKAGSNTYYTNGNESGMYKKTGGTMEPTAGTLEDNTTMYSAVRTTIRVK
ncbi:MAG: hypothetical protein IKJ32_00055 [Clostridia bacterium]|nr:hypothetical protein [Clostridia bacterium]